MPTRPPPESRSGPAGACPAPGPEKLKMLNVFRENLKHLKWVLLLVVASFVYAIFALWGGGAGKDTAGAPGDQLWAARVEGDVISIQDLQREARNLEATYRQILGAQYNQQRSFIKLGQMAIRSLVDRELMEREARRAGLAVTAEEVAEAVMADPGLQQNGVFIGKERYEKLFRGNPASIEAFEREVARNLLLEKLRSLIQDSVVVSNAEVREAYARQNEKISIEYLLFDSSKLPAAPPSEKEVEDFYRSHLSDYETGEGRTGRYVLFDVRTIAAGIDVPESEVRSQYLQDLKARFKVPEKRRASHILVKLPATPSSDQVKSAESKIRRALARVRSGEDFGKVAREMSEDSTAANGGDLSYFAHDQMVREFSDAAWSLKVGQVSDPVRSSFGFHVIRLTDIQPGRELTLEEARPQILTQLKAARARDEARRRSEDFVKQARSDKRDLATSARTAGVTVMEMPAHHRGDEIPGLGIQPLLEDRLFDLEPGEISEPVSLASGHVVVQFVSTTPSVALPLETARDRVRDDCQRLAQVTAVQKRIASGGGALRLEATAKKLRMEVRKAGPIPRSGPIPELGGDESLMDRLFSLKVGEVTGPLAVSTGGVALLRVTSHTDPMEGYQAQEQTLRNSLLLAKRDRLFRAYQERLRQGSRIEINTALVNQIDQA